MKYLLIGLLKLWRLCISPLYGDVCRYYPSCSAYALRAVHYHGAFYGSWLAARRLLSCHPWAAGGYDPVRGTPEFDLEMRERAAAAATMGSAAVAGAAEGAATDQGRMKLHVHDHEAHTRPSQGEEVTVAQGRGKK